MPEASASVFPVFSCFVFRNTTEVVSKAFLRPSTPPTTITTTPYSVCSSCSHMGCRSAASPREGRALNTNVSGPAILRFTNLTSAWATATSCKSHPHKGIFSSQTTGQKVDYAKAKTDKHTGKQSGQEPITMVESGRINGPSMAELAPLPWEAPGSSGSVNRPFSTSSANTAQFPSAH